MKYQFCSSDIWQKHKSNSSKKKLYISFTTKKKYGVHFSTMSEKFERKNNDGKSCYNPELYSRAVFNSL